MTKNNFLSSSFKIKKFQSSEDRDFIKALKIYNDMVPVETKTATNEITYFLDKKDFKNREIFFFGLYYNNEVIGYIECGYLRITKTIIIDYLILKTEFNLNSIFYPLFALFQQYFSDNLIDYDYIITEVSTRTLAENVDKESYYTRKLLQAEDFRIINMPYPQPLLGINNFESNFDLRLMVKSINTIGSLKTDTLINIIKDIYYNHYLDWYENTIIEDETLEKYKNHIDEQMDKVVNYVEGENIILLQESLEGICDHYCSENCFYSEISTAGFAINTNSTSKDFMWLIRIPIIIGSAVLLAFLIHFIISKSNISSNEIVPIFAAVSATLTGLLALSFSNKTKD